MRHLRSLSRCYRPQALWQRCYVHLLRNAADHLDRKADAEALTELRWVYDRANVAEATKDISAWIERWSKKAPRLVGWVEANIYESLSFYRFLALAVLAGLAALSAARSSSQLGVAVRPQRL